LEFCLRQINKMPKNWFLTIVIVLIVAILVTTVIGFFLKVRKEISAPSSTNCVSPTSNPYMTDIIIGTYDSKQSDNSYCPPNQGWTSVPIHPSLSYINQSSNGIPYSQLCYKTMNKYCDQTPIVTDLHILDMTDSSVYRPPSTRCSSLKTFYPPANVNLSKGTNLQQTVGSLPNSIQGCKKMGLCAQQTLLSDLRKKGGQYLPSNNIAFVSSSDSSSSPIEICQKALGDGYTTDGNNIYSGCNTNDRLFLCKKYEKI